MKLLAIAQNIFREAIRDKILYNLLFFSLIMILASGMLSTLTVGERNKIIIDVGVGSINIFGLLISIFLGISLVSKEISRRTIYTILSKPIRRWEFLLAKYIGLSLTLLLNTVVMSLVLSGTLRLVGEHFTMQIFIPIGMIYLECLVVMAVAMLFSTFTTATLSAIFTIAIYVSGQFSSDLVGFSQNQKFSLANKKTMMFIYYTVPNLDYFNFKSYASNTIPIPFDQLGWSIAYGLIYILTLLGISMLVFQRREFK